MLAQAVVIGAGAEALQFAFGIETYRGYAPILK